MRNEKLRIEKLKRITVRRKKVQKKLNIGRNNIQQKELNPETDKKVKTMKYRIEYLSQVFGKSRKRMPKKEVKA